MPHTADPLRPERSRTPAALRPWLWTAVLVLALSVIFAVPVQAQSCDPDDGDCPIPPPPPPPPPGDDSSDTGGDRPSREAPEIERRDRSFINPRGTASITAQIDGIAETCDRLNQDYALHCLTVELRRAVDQIPAEGDYADVRAALVDAARGLQALVDANVDPGQPAVRARIGGRPAAPLTRPIVAIRPDTAAAARAEAERLLDEAATVLLRSAGNSARRQAAFQPIAQAIGSTKVLLRST